MMILSRYQAILLNPPEGDVSRPVRISMLGEDQFIVEYSDLIEHPEVVYPGVIRHDPRSGNFVGYETIDGEVVNELQFDISQNGGMINGYPPHDVRNTMITLPGQPETAYANASLTVTESLVILAAYGVEIIKFVNPRVQFKNENKYSGPTEDKRYGQVILEAISPYNGQRLEAVIYDVGCGCAVETIEKKLGSVQIFPVGE